MQNQQPIHPGKLICRVVLSAVGGLLFLAAADGTASANHLELGTSGGNAEDTGTILRGRFLEIPVCCSGTLGALMTDSDGNRYVLSARHVIAPTGSLSNGVVSPGLIDTEPDACTVAQTTTVAAVTATVPAVEFDPTDPVATTTAADASIAQEIGTAEDGNPPFDDNGAIADIGTINDTLSEAETTIGQSVMKRGRTSGLTFGTVSEKDVSVDVFSADDCGSETGITLHYTGQIFVTRGNFADSGDSGSVVLTTQTASEALTSSGVNAVGLLFAGSNQGVFVNPLEDVDNALEVASSLTLDLLAPGGNSNVLTGRGGGPGGGPGGPQGAFSPQQSLEGLSRAIEAKRRHEDALFDTAGVVAVGVGRDEDGSPVISVHLESAIADAGQPIPSEIEGVQVRTIVTGPVVAY